MEHKYIFRSNRLGFRNWKTTDLDKMAAINAHKDVMAFFPERPSQKQTAEFMARMQKQFTAKGYCYFAVELLSTYEFIGFIGLSEQTFKSSFTPCTDIGWRLHKNHWNQGYATEGAQRCLQYAFDTLNLHQIYAIAPKVNKGSVHVMQKIGMVYQKDFEHPRMLKNKQLKKCVLYSVNATDND